MRHYEVQSILIFGAKTHFKGEVLPEWYANRDGGLAARVANGALVPTHKAVTEHLEVPAPKTEADPVPSMVAEQNRLAAELRDALADNKLQRDAVKELEARLKGYEAQLASATQTIGTLHTQLTAAERERDELLARATEPELEPA